MRKTFIALCLPPLPTRQRPKKKATTISMWPRTLTFFNAIYKNLDMMYVDTLDANQTVGTGVNAMLKALDPYTVYYPEDKVKDLKFMITGKYGGIGALIKYNSQLKRVTIEEPYENMPAAEVGLKKGDIILAIDNEDMTKKRPSIRKRPPQRRPRNKLYLAN